MGSKRIGSRFVGKLPNNVGLSFRMGYNVCGAHDKLGAVFKNQTANIPYDYRLGPICVYGTDHLIFYFKSFKKDALRSRYYYLYGILLGNCRVNRSKRETFQTLRQLFCFWC